MATPPDPAAMFRQMLGQWEQMANSFGNDTMRTEEFARTMQGASAATMTMQSAFRDAMEKGLATANLPTRTDVEALTARVAAMEGTLARIEARLAGDAPAAPAKPRPTRGRKPAAD